MVETKSIWELKERIGKNKEEVEVVVMCVSFAWLFFTPAFSIGFQSWERGENGADKNGIWGTPHSHREGT